MAVHKGFHARYALLAAPLACLAAFAAGARFPLPAFLLPVREFVAFRSPAVGGALGDEPGAAQGDNPLAAAGGSGARLVLPGRVVPKPRDRGALDALQAELPARVDLSPAFAAAVGSARPLRILMNGQPSADDIAAARGLYRSSGAPVRFVVSEAPASPLAAVSAVIEPNAASFGVTLLIAEDAARSGSIDVFLDGEPAYRSEAASLAPDRRIALAASPRAGASTVLVELRAHSGSGSESRASVTLALGGRDRERVLMATPKGDARSSVEALFPARKVSPGELASADLYAYELVVLDSLSLSGLGPDLDRRLARYVESGAGSVLAVADSPDFGKEGSAPALERLLPVELSPRSVKNLPDLAMLVLIDVSGSMFGDKLSLAKVTGVETMGNLKPDDLVGVLLFSEDSEWLYRFQPAGGASGADMLAPLRAGGGTKLYPALEKGMDELEAAPMPVKHIVVVSDGITEPADFDRLVTRAKRAGITITAMAVGDSFDRALLTRLSAGTGGRLYRVLDAGEVPSLIVEDRKSVSRTVFAQERTPILSLDGSAAGSVDGMARFTARKDSLVVFSSPAGDPLLSSNSVAGRSALVFASDLYGRFSSGFFADPAALAGFRATLAGLFREDAPGAVLTETADGLHLSLRGEGLVAPTLALADGHGELVATARFASDLPGWWTAAVSPASGGAYTALVMDRGTTVARLPVWANAGLSAWTDEDAAAYLSYRAPFFALLPGRTAWLLCFFALSLAVSLWLRTRR